MLFLYLFCMVYDQRLAPLRPKLVGRSFGHFTEKPSWEIIPLLPTSQTPNTARRDRNIYSLDSQDRLVWTTSSYELMEMKCLFSFMMDKFP